MKIHLKLKITVTFSNNKFNLFLFGPSPFEFLTQLYIRRKMECAVDEARCGLAFHRISQVAVRIFLRESLVLGILEYLPRLDIPISFIAKPM